MSMYIHISNNQTKDFFAKSKPSDFRAKLPYTVNLDPDVKYEVALVDIMMPAFETGYKPEYLIVCSSICEPSIIDLSLRPILRRLKPDEIGKSVDFVATRYVNLATASFDLIDIYLSDQTGAQPSFLKGSLYATLHNQACALVLFFTKPTKTYYRNGWIL